MNIAQQLTNLAGQEVVLKMICYGAVHEESTLTGRLSLLGNHHYQVGQWQFSGKYVPKIDGASIFFDLDLQSEDIDASEDQAELDEEWRRIGEAHMKDLRKMGWEG